MRVWAVLALACLALAVTAAPVPPANAQPSAKVIQLSANDLVKAAGAKAAGAKAADAKAVAGGKAAVLLKTEQAQVTKTDLINPEFAAVSAKLRKLDGQCNNATKWNKCGAKSDLWMCTWDPSKAPSCAVREDYRRSQLANVAGCPSSTLSNIRRCSSSVHNKAGCLAASSNDCQWSEWRRQLLATKESKPAAYSGFCSHKQMLTMKKAADTKAMRLLAFQISHMDPAVWGDCGAVGVLRGTVSQRMGLPCYLASNAGACGAAAPLCSWNKQEAICVSACDAKEEAGCKSPACVWDAAGSQCGFAVGKHAVNPTAAATAAPSRRLLQAGAFAPFPLANEDLPDAPQDPQAEVDELPTGESLDQDAYIPADEAGAKDEQPPADAAPMEEDPAVVAKAKAEAEAKAKAEADAAHAKQLAAEQAARQAAEAEAARQRQAAAEQLAAKKNAEAEAARRKKDEADRAAAAAATEAQRLAVRAAADEAARKAAEQAAAEASRLKASADAVGATQKNKDEQAASASAAAVAAGDEAERLAAVAAASVDRVYANGGDFLCAGQASNVTCFEQRMVIGTLSLCSTDEQATSYPCAVAQAIREMTGELLSMARTIEGGDSSKAFKPTGLLTVHTEKNTTSSGAGTAGTAGLTAALAFALSAAVLAV